MGSGPSGYFSGLALLEAGFDVQLIEQGSPADIRSAALDDFEKTGILHNYNNYTNGEGGAGTFSDGKLTSRTKTISKEKDYIFSRYIKAGAPPEIRYLSKPHIGSDNLRNVVKSLRALFIDKGGKYNFNERFSDLTISNGKCTALMTEKNVYTGDYFLLGIGHSSYDTVKMLITKGIFFRNKPFAAGVRVEHFKSEVNFSQYGVECLNGVKAADYFITQSKSEKLLPVYTFCMCPGGKVIPSAPWSGINIVNGVSDYSRNGDYSNAAVVAAFDLADIIGKDISPLDALNFTEELGRKSFEMSGSYKAPFNTIKDFMSGKISSSSVQSSYPFEIFPCSYEKLLPAPIVESLRAAFVEFSKRLRFFKNGIMIGIETTTSSPVQSVRGDNRNCIGVDNLFIIGEASGFSGGIISSAADGLKTASAVIDLNM